VLHRPQSLVRSLNDTTMDRHKANLRGRKKFRGRALFCGSASTEADRSTMRRSLVYGGQDARTRARANLNSGTLLSTNLMSWGVTGVPSETPVRHMRSSRKQSKQAIAICGNSSVHRSLLHSSKNDVTKAGSSGSDISNKMPAF
jgi:hypothetical protein